MPRSRPFERPTQPEPPRLHSQQATGEQPLADERPALMQVFVRIAVGDNAGEEYHLGSITPEVRFGSPQDGHISAHVDIEGALAEFFREAAKRFGHDHTAPADTR